MMTLLDLFSGIGGFSLAAEWAGIETVAFCEKDPFCRQVLIKHWPGVLKYLDIKDVSNPGYVDIITAGFPCQPFSVAGKQKGINDDRYLWPEVMRLIRVCKPTWFIGENVPGIIPHIDPILKDLENEGYDWRTFLIPASAVHAPHKRERLWIIAHRNNDGRSSCNGIWQERLSQDDRQRHVETLQREWAEFQPESWTTFNAQEWLGFVADTTGSEGRRQHQAISEEGSKQGTLSGRENSGIEFTANANSQQRQQGKVYQAPESERSQWEKSTRETGEAVAYTESISHPDSQSKSQTDQGVQSQSTTWPRHSRTDRSKRPIFNWQEDQPEFSRMDDGFSVRLDQGVPVPGVELCEDGLNRNKSLGNSIVPQIPYIFMKIILEIENATTNEK